MLVVYALGRILTAHKSEYFVYRTKAELIYFVFRGYKIVSFYEKFTNELIVLRQMFHITKCILDELSEKKV